MAGPYRVKFENPATGQGFIEGYRTARRAKEVVGAYNALFEKEGGNGIRAEYPVLKRKFGL